MGIDVALLLLRLAVGLTFAAHGAQKAFGWWSGPGMDGWTAAMERMNFRPARLWALVSTAAELGGGLLLAVGLLTPFAAAVLVGQAIVIIGQAHWERGFFNTKGGFEYPLTLGAVAIALTLAGAGAFSFDAAMALDYPLEVRLGLIVVGVIGGFIGLALPRSIAANTEH
jgi:putative oxidoreductase